MSDEQNAQEASQQNLEVTPANTEETTEQTTETQGTQEGKPAEEQVTTKSEGWEYNGNRKEVPKEFQQFVKGLDRYVSRKDQALAETQKQLEEIQIKLSSVPEPTQIKKDPQPLVTQDELDAISLGDGKVLESVINRAVDLKIKADPSREQVEKQVTSLSAKQRIFDARDSITEFAAITPEFKEVLETPIGDHIIAAVQRGATLEQAWQQAQDVMTWAGERHETKRKANLENKANGSTVKNTVTGKSDTVWVENDKEARRTAIELQLKGDPRKVAIRPKK